ncbi:MAG: FtsQ-type POTRA domain-containing protein, partial [Anaerolinea sp.]|nr:FtsQ-type POTRA domain-containing protein [Anaerolinea sp.]
MTTQSRERTPQAARRSARRRSARVTPRRDPAIWYGSTPLASRSAARPAVPQAARGGFGVSWRVVSGVIVIALIGLLVLVFVTDAFYVYGPEILGLEYMTPNEVFAISGLANLHVFWVDPAEVRRSLLQSPTIADARVEVGFAQPLVTIHVEERQPALAWEQAGVQVWLDVQGRVMRQRGAR